MYIVINMALFKRRPAPSNTETKRHKVVLAVSLDMEYIEWIDYNVKCQIFRNRSHGVQYCLAHCREESMDAKRKKG